MEIPFVYLLFSISLTTLTISPVNLLLYHTIIFMATQTTNQPEQLHVPYRSSCPPYSKYKRRTAGQTC